MATVATTIPRPRTKRRPRNQPAAGRASFPDTYFVKRMDNSRLRREINREKCRECYGLLALGMLVFLAGLPEIKQQPLPESEGASPSVVSS